MVQPSAARTSTVQLYESVKPPSLSSRTTARSELLALLQRSSTSNGKPLANSEADANSPELLETAPPITRPTLHAGAPEPHVSRRTPTELEIPGSES